jgi:hypothetical protein
MSAWIVSKEHVDVLTRFAIERSRGTFGFSWWQVDADGRYAGWRKLDEHGPGVDPERFTPSQLGQVLVSENVRSVHHRYPSDDVDAGELPGPCDAYYLAPYVYEDPGYVLSPGEVFKAIDCLDYQSCETDDWHQTEAFALLRSLREEACAMVNGYEAAPWGFDAESLSALRKVSAS